MRSAIQYHLIRTNALALVVILYSFPSASVGGANEPTNLAAVSVTADEKKLEPTKDSLDTVKKNLAARKAVIVDVRSVEETKSGHIKGAILLPVTELLSKPDEKAIRKAIAEGKIVYTYCVVGKRALAGGEVLQKLGYDARPLKNGYAELLDAGFESVKP